MVNNFNKQVSYTESELMDTNTKLIKREQINTDI